MYVHSDTLLHFFVTNTLQDELPCLKAYIIAGCCTCLLTSQMLLSLSVFLSAWILCLFLCMPIIIFWTVWGLGERLGLVDLHSGSTINLLVGDGETKGSC